MEEEGRSGVLFLISSPHEEEEEQEEADLREHIASDITQVITLSLSLSLLGSWAKRIGAKTNVRSSIGKIKMRSIV